ncbi:MAG: hypothetical protein ACRC1P_11070 [Cellulosilyticaceae bacterium]
MANLESFAFIGVKNLVFKNKQTGRVECNLKHMVNINIEDSMAEDFLRGAYGNEKLLTIFGDRDSKLTGSTATQTTDLIKVMSNSEIATKMKDIQQVEDISLVGGKFTLKLNPVSGAAMDVYAIGSDGKSTRLTLGAAATDGQYAITGKDITCNSSVKRVRVFYMANEEVETIEIKDITPKNWDINGLLVAKEIETGKLFTCVLEVPNGSVTPNFSMGAENKGGAPAPVDLTINMMKDEGKGYPYALNFKEDK